MGLDIYLSKKTYVKQWEHKKPEEQYEVSVTKGGVPVHSIKKERVSYITEEVGYWRKANQIHKWFVDNVQDGEDNCQEYEVSTEQLKELLDLCKKVLEVVEIEKVIEKINRLEDGKIKEVEEEQRKIVNTAEMEDILSTTSGFFFGSTEYDEYYLQDIEYTVKTLEEILAEENTSADYYYQSSW